MKTLAIAYVTTAIAFLGCDSIWLSLAASRLYKPKLGAMLLPNFNLAPAAAFYLLYVAGIVLLAVQPALGAGRWTGASLRGAMLGLVAYATYDLTNQATLRGWSAAVTVADLCWGTFATAVAATIGYLVTSAIVGRV